MPKKFDLSVIKDYEKARAFIKQFDSALRKHASSAGGSCWVAEDKIYVYGTRLSLNGRKSPVDVVIRCSSPGCIRELEIYCPDSPETEDFVFQIASQSLINTLAEKRERFFRRVFYCYFGTELDGEYWLQGIRVAPAGPGDHPAQIDKVERFITFDMHVEAVDIDEANSIALHESAKLAARLSFLTHIGLYTPTSEHRWVLPGHDDSIQPSILMQLGYYGKCQEIAEMPRKGALCGAGKYDGSLLDTVKFLGEQIKLPSLARKIISGANNAVSDKAEAFDNCCRLYQVALTAGRYSPTLQMSYFVAAVDALTAVEPPFNSFSGLVRYYSQSSPNLDSLLNFLHGSVRSAHFHAGSFPFGEFSKRDDLWIFKDMSQHELDTKFRLGRYIIRETIVNWALDNFKVSEQ